MLNKLWLNETLEEHQEMTELMQEHRDKLDLDRLDHGACIEYLHEFHTQSVEAEEYFVILLNVLNNKEIDLNDEQVRRDFYDILLLASFANDSIMTHLEQDVFSQVLIDTMAEKILEKRAPLEDKVEHPKKRD